MGSYYYLVILKVSTNTIFDNTSPTGKIHVFIIMKSSFSSWSTTFTMSYCQKSNGTHEHNINFGRYIIIVTPKVLQFSIFSIEIYWHWFHYSVKIHDEGSLSAILLEFVWEKHSNCLLAIIFGEYWSKLQFNWNVLMDVWWRLNIWYSMDNNKWNMRWLCKLINCSL